MTEEAIFNRRMNRLDKLIEEISLRYVNIYSADDKMNELYKLHSNDIDTDYVNEFTKKVNDYILKTIPIFRR